MSTSSSLVLAPAIRDLVLTLLENIEHFEEQIRRLD
jgi:hypothetical protein